MGATPSRRRLLGVALAVSLGSIPAAAAAQNAVITGRVTSETGQPLPGANVFITEMNVSVGTNASGQYTVSIPQARVAGQSVQLRVRSVGFTPQQRTITVTAGQQTVDFTLRPDVTRLSEVVVTGVSGATERAKVPFSVARIDSTDMPVVATNPLTQLQGKVPGATISGVTGRPGQAPAVLLRGPTSINGQGRGQEPLYIVDGVILAGSIADLNASDIESVEVVKGAAAASLYGSRAAAGVIQITTKQGSAGQDGVRFTLRSEYGFNDIEGDFGLARHHPFLTDETGTRFCVQDGLGSNKTCSRTIDYHREVARINNDPGDFALPTATFPLDPGSVTTGSILRQAFVMNQWQGRVYNAVDQLVDPRPLAINDLSASGRFGNTTFFASVGHTEQGGAIMGLSGYERVSGRVNLGHRLNDQWEFSVTSFFSRSEQDGVNQEEGGQGFFRLTRTPAIVDITQRDTLGRLYIRTNLATAGVQNENPLYSFENVERADVRYRFMGGLSAKYSPLTWLDIDGNASIDRLSTDFRQFQNRGFRTTNSNPGTNGGFILNGTNNNQSVNASLQATSQWQPLTELASRFNLRALYEQQDFDQRFFDGTALRVGDVDDGRNITANQRTISSRNSTRQLSFSANAFLDYRDRYTADLLVRQDGSSRFGANERWQTYGRGSVAWLMAREDWFPSDRISTFTLRGSLGSAGNTPSVDAQYETYTIGAGGTLAAATLGNPDLRPEVSTEIEAGLDIELFERIGLSGTYARSLTRNQILPVPVSVTTGFATQWQNAGTLENRTWEASLTVPILRQPDLGWTARLNYTSNVPTIRELHVPSFNIGTALQGTGNMIRIEEGMRYGTIVGRRFLTSCGELPQALRGQCGSPTSAFQRNDEGYLVWVGEGNNPGMGITDNLWNTTAPAGQRPWGAETNFGMPIVLRGDDGAAQQVPLGHALPDYRLGVSQNFHWRRLSAFALLDGAFGQSVWNEGRHWSYLDFLSADVDQAGKDIHDAKPIGYYYRANTADGQSGIGGFYDVLGPNNRFVEDASYMKLRELSVSYRVGPVGGSGDWTASIVGRNLLTVTGYSGFDPEVGVGNTTNNQAGSGLINAVDAFTFPNLRTVSFVLTTSF